VIHQRNSALLSNKERLSCRLLRYAGPVDPLDLEAALQSAKLRDEQAMTILFRVIHPSLEHYLRRQAPDVAEDLASETWLAVAMGLPEFQGGVDEFRSWLFTIAHRRVVDHYRSVSRRPRLIFREEDDLTRAHSGTGRVLSAEATAVEDLSTDEAIAALVRDLPLAQAEIVLLRVVADLSVEQVAEITGRSPGSVRVLQHRALRRLAKIWEQEGVTR
jgi:RNA polymerase sigma-70 factor, ECF subfamily